MVLAGVIVVAVVVAAAVALLGRSPGKSRTATSTTHPINTDPINTPAKIAALFAGIPQHGDTLGRPGAPVTVLAFEDPQSTLCGAWNLTTLPVVLTRFVRTGRVKLVYRGIQVVGPNSEVGLRAIAGAVGQNALWSMNEAIYVNQGKVNSGWLTSPLVVNIAVALGLDEGKLIGGANSQAATRALAAAAGEATTYKVRSTPSFVILRPAAAPKRLRLNGSSLAPAGFVSALNAAIG